ncbi:choice-of-anchor G family protein [Leucobacter chironomi]|uniref:choice-of-anchor G family protein n=1 Tax=Leucobacter chironomi TaxID=491918 RepID=UPI0013757653|nr:choice-of-anchor G family protein [Leucobacter chironomi]
MERRRVGARRRGRHRGLLELLADNSTGVVGQFGQARTDGLAHGAAGYVTDSGGIDLADAQTGQYPHLATLKLSNLLNSPLLGNVGLGNTLSDVSDLEVEVGAVAGEAELEACAEAWGAETAQQAVAASTAEDIVAGLERRYLAASADLTFTSLAAGALAEGLDTLLGQVQSVTSGLIGQNGVKAGVESGVAALLNGLISTPLLSLGSITLNTLTATIDLAPTRALVNTPFSDSGGVVAIDARHGTVLIDTSALLQQAYPEGVGEGLNGLPPNTNLLADPAILTALTQSLTTALTEWLGHIETSLVSAVDRIQISSTLSVNLRARLLSITPFIDVGHIAVTVSGTLADLRVNTPGTVTAELQLLGGLLSGLTDLLTKGVLKPVIDLLLVTLVGGTGGVIGGVVTGVLPAVTALPTRFAGVTGTLLSLVSRLYTGLFLSNIVTITVNAQNAPASGGPPPPDWAPGQPTAPPAGRYEVAAIRVGVLDGLGPNGVRLYLGRASVGPGCSAARAAQPGSPCAAY